MTLSEFRIRFPEFRQASDTLVQASLDAALLRTPADIWEDLQDEGQGYLAAHLLSMSPGGKEMRKGEKAGETMYLPERKRLAGIVSSGFRIAGLP